MYINHNAVIQNAAGIIKRKLLAMPSTLLDSAKESERGVWSSRCFMVQLSRWQNPEDKHWKGRVPGYKGGDCGEDSRGHGGVRKASQNKQNQTFSWEKQGERERGVRSSKRRGPGISMLAGGPARWPWQEFPGNPKWLDWALTLGFDDLRNSNNCVQFNSVTQSCPNLCNPHGLQHARLPCTAPTPGACSNSCLLSQWCHPTISSCVVPFSSCLQSFPSSESFTMNQFFTSGGQSIGVSAAASVLPKNI